MGLTKIALEKSIPYLSNIELVRETLKDIEECEDAIKYLEDLIKNEKNITLKTDYVIILNFLRKLCSENKNQKI